MHLGRITLANGVSALPTVAVTSLYMGFYVPKQSNAPTVLAALRDVSQQYWQHRCGNPHCRGKNRVCRHDHSWQISSALCSSLRSFLRRDAFPICFS